MRRDFGSELIVAIVAVAVLAFAFIFGIIISLSGSGGAATDLLPTTMPEPIPPPILSSFALTATAIAAVPVPPTATPTNTPTPVPPTATPTVTPVTSQVVIPTLALPTAAALPTALTLPDGLPIPTGVPPIANRFGCTAPAGWVAYTLLPEDTLYSVTFRAASEIAIIAAINCLPPDAVITAGDVIFLPILPLPAPTLIPIFPGGTAIPGTPAAVQAAALPLTASGCTAVGSRIAAPLLGQIIIVPATVTGTAFVPAGQGSFFTYTLAVRPALSPVYTIYAISDQPVEFGELAVLNPGWFGGGVHYLRLTVTRADGSTVLPCDIPVIFRSP